MMASATIAGHAETYRDAGGTQMQLIGTVVRLQVQQSSLKAGDRPRRWYDPTPIVPVPMLTLDENGVTGWTGAGAMVPDVHNATHPVSKFRGENGVSFGFTSHYAAMRARFGDHLTDGIAGENILIETDRTFHEEEFAHGIRIESADGSHANLTEILSAEPCAEFSRFSLRYSLDTPSDRIVAEALNFLRMGTRGFYAVAVGSDARVRVGDRVFITH
jgi:hypothetical protein